MADMRFDCGKCTNKAYSEVYSEMYGEDMIYCLPMISTGKSPIELHDMGGTKKGDYMTCNEYMTEPMPLAIYEAVCAWAERKEVAR